MSARYAQKTAFSCACKQNMSPKLLFIVYINLRKKILFLNYGDQMMQTVLKKELVIDNSHSFLLSDLPFKTGEKVVVFVMSETDLTAKLQKWRTLFKETQVLPQVKDITDADIDAEIEDYRAGL